jgi:thioredoxin reductase
MIRHWSPDLIYFENDRVRPTKEQEEQFKALGIRRVVGAVRRLITNEGRLQAVELENGEKYERTAVFLGTHLIANTSLLKSLGAAIRETPQGPVVDVDPQGRTSATGVWAAGNVTNASIQVIGAAAAGNLAGASINMDLIQEDHERSVIAMRLAREQGGRDRA